MHSTSYRALQGLVSIGGEGLSVGPFSEASRSVRPPRITCAGSRVLTLLVGILTLLAWVSPARAQPRTVTVSVVASKSVVTPGDQFAVAVIFDHAAGWHVHTNAPVVPRGWDFTPIPTVITFTTPGNLKSGAIQWPAVYEILADLAGTGRPSKYGVFADKAIAYVPFVVDAAATLGKRTLSFDVSYQACNDRTCNLLQEEKFVIEFEITAPGTLAPATAAQPADPSIFANLDMTAFAAVRAGSGTANASGPAVATAAPVKFQVFNWSFTIDPSGPVGLIVMVLLAMLGGFVLNLTPCVLPVIPIKIMGLSAVAGNPRRMLTLGLIMCAGTVAFWLAIGVAIASVASFKAINQLFQTPFFALAIGVFILVMAVGMIGWFTISLPQAVYAVDPKRESPAGSFMFGVLTAVLSTPCTAPFMASASAWAATQRPSITMFVFAAIGVGMALPYAVLSAFPKLVDKIPRTGPASELVKQVMGLLMLAVAVFFLGTGLDPLIRAATAPPIRFHWWLVAFIVACAMGWLLFRAWQLTKKPSWRVGWAVVAVVATLATGAAARSITDRGPISWLAYTPATFKAAIDADKVVVLDFTAEWCLNCKVLEATVLHKPEIVKLLNGPGVVAMRVDLTGKNPEGADKLKELQWVGIPLLAIYGPGSAEPQKFDTYTQSVVADAIARARGPRLGSSGNPAR